MGNSRREPQITERDETKMARFKIFIKESKRDLEMEDAIKAIKRVSGLNS